MKKIIVTLLIAVGISVPLFFSFAVTGTIDPTYKYAWSNNVGWINFGCSDCAVQVTDTAITGHAWAENVGWINLSPTGGGGITNSGGNLSGSAWGEIAGWIDFDNVQINSLGQFTGTATGDIVGTVVFDSCGTGCGVKTTWTPSSGGGGGEEGGGPGGTAGSIHNICVNDTCVSVAGAGPNMCQNADDCLSSSHAECQGQTCVPVSGLGTNQCQVNNDCIQPKHNICQNNQCVLADGEGADLCLTAQDCLFSHSECENSQCVQIQGVGINQCQADSECLATQSSHTICFGQKCAYVDGQGINQCNNDVDCGQAPVIPQQHNVCLNQTCTVVNGAGVNSCQDNADCQGVITPPDQPSPESPDEPPFNFPDIVPPVIKEAAKTVASGISEINQFLKTAEGTVVATVATTTGIIGGLLYTLSMFVFAPGVVFEMVFIPLRLASLLGAVTGIRRKIVHWGVVYDSQTKRPLDPVRVALVNMEGKEIASTITDVDGRYGFLVDAGIYKITARKTHYDFPSKKLAGKLQDEVYEDLYFGDQLEIKTKGDVIKKNIPLDPLGFDWNEFAKSHGGILKFYSQFDRATRLAADIIFGLGFIVSIWAYFAAPPPYNVAIVILYFGLLALRIFVFKPKSFGYIENKSGQPLSFAMLKIFSASLNIEVGHKITDAFGRYYCLIPKGRYYIKVAERQPDNSYKEVFTSPIVDASRRGIIKNHFKV